MCQRAAGLGTGLSESPGQQHDGWTYDRDGPKGKSELAHMLPVSATPYSVGGSWCDWSLQWPSNAQQCADAVLRIFCAPKCHGLVVEQGKARTTSALPRLQTHHRPDDASMEAGSGQGLGPVQVSSEGLRELWPANTSGRNGIQAAHAGAWPAGHGRGASSRSIRNYCSGSGDKGTRGGGSHSAFTLRYQIDSFPSQPQTHPLLLVVSPDSLAPTWSG